MAELFTEDELREELISQMGDLSINAWAKAKGLTPQQVYSFINRERRAEPKLIEALGFERVVLYTPRC